MGTVHVHGRHCGNITDFLGAEAQVLEHKRAVIGKKERFMQQPINYSLLCCWTVASRVGLFDEVDAGSENTVHYGRDWARINT